MENCQFIEARFTDDSRETIMSLWVNEDSDEAFEMYCPTDTSDPTYQEIMKYMSLDDLHEATWTFIKDSEKQIEDIAVEVAKEKGWIYDIENVDEGLKSNLYKAIVKTLFQDYDPELHREQLFLLKLELFEMPFLQNSNDKALKKRLRKASTILDVIKVAIEIYDASQD